MLGSLIKRCFFNVLRLSLFDSHWIRVRRLLEVQDVVAAILAALAIKVGGYYLAEVILAGNFLSPIGSIPGNVLQIAFAAAIILAVYPACRRAAARLFPVRSAT
jgi:hypothetical protein